LNLGYVFCNAVSRFADRVAVSDATRGFSFIELGGRVNRLGNALDRLGVRRGERIASLQHNSIEMLEVDVTAACFGYVRTLLNARGNAADHRHALQLTAAKALIFGAEFAGQIAGLRSELPLIEHYICVGDGPAWALDYTQLLSEATPLPPQDEVGEDDWHSIYLTSGTTGKPKGVVLSQRNWLAVVRNHLVDTYQGTGPEDVLLHTAPMSHASGSLAFAHLVRGARQHIVDGFDAAATLELFKRERITTVWLAPTMLIRLLDHEDAQPRDLSALKSVRYGGAPMPAERVREAVARWGAIFCTGWGQWEAPQQCTFHTQAQIGAAAARGDLKRLASVGRPMTFSRVAIIDEEGHELPAGETGEVAVAGDHVMVGYLEQPDETAALRTGPWQRTGDVGSFDEEVFLYLSDRKRDVIISGGSNIYPREIEEIVHAHPAVQEALVVGIPDREWGEAVHVLVVPRPGYTLEPTTFLAWCRERLPGYKRPRSCETALELPKNAYGKVMRREIRDRYWAGQDRKI
jgi:acyl-CoA synthetase (AMP-forming)/AMP-acid ligase II